MAELNLDALTAEIAELEASAADVLAVLANTNNELDEVKAMLAALETANAEEQGKVDAITARVDGAQKALDAVVNPPVVSEPPVEEPTV